MLQSTSRTIRFSGDTDDFMVCFDRDGNVHKVIHRTVVMSEGGVSGNISPRLALRAMRAVNEALAEENRQEEWRKRHAAKVVGLKA